MFKNKQLIAWSFIVLLTVSSGCKSKFEKLKASNDTAKKYQEAIRLYNKKDYSKAQILFDDLLQRYRGRSEAEDLSYYSAFTNYKLKDYTTARYLFKVFADTYPSSARAEECRYMSAYCYYLESPKYSLDQDNTLKAIDALQLFINLYPKSTRVAEASKYIDDLRNKLETKAYTLAKQYLDMGGYDPQNYRSAVIAFKNALRDYPDTKYGEEMEFLTIKAQYLFAKNSLETKQEERFDEVLSQYSEFTDKYPQSTYMKDATDYKKDAERDMANVKKLLAQQEMTYKADSASAKKN
ncbi:outer membrane protein assembly factor BamD [Pedobacter sp. HMF7647]|uniref:Outer membrane protein assembly factor BamD n=1 Tax=Hufsiella arboris TaxID=2695275 RepID=A0A7K1YEE8_9SPHI|nr:outer membrane protein assembly factor BamD [Hufsiella arboris]MXV52984.1 outer membrane protein assembly factor BamD [Hufsiella arboris]